METGEKIQTFPLETKPKGLDGVLSQSISASFSQFPSSSINERNGTIWKLGVFALCVLNG